MNANASKVIPVILAGGVGARLWPVSRTYYPKQFHRLLGTESFLQSTMNRARAVTPEPAIVVCNEEHRFMVAEQCREAGIQWSRLILEPEGRNSAPAIGLAAVAAIEIDPDAILLVLPSDHLVNDVDAFRDAVDLAVRGALEGALVTFGISPDRPETGYGYIRHSEGEQTLQRVDAFVEKPDLETAKAYLKAGNYLWNSGMFVLGAQTYLDELGRFEPDMARACAASMNDIEVDLDFLRPGKAFLDSPAKSIDFAVMERTDRAQVVPVSFGWNDIGSWDSLAGELPLDGQGNHFAGDVVAVDTTESLVLSQNRLIAALGLDNVIVVETADAVLVANRDRVQDVKAIVNQLAKHERGEQHFHKEVFRPWGSYEGIAEGERYQVKCIRVKPGGALSLQLHHHRSEHWIVVKGSGRVTRGEEVLVLGENESTYIPRGVKHRLENPGKIELELIEVQVGPYLSEDDIERFDDVYGR